MIIQEYRRGDGIGGKNSGNNKAMEDESNPEAGLQLSLRYTAPLIPGL